VVSTSAFKCRGSLPLIPEQPADRKSTEFGATVNLLLVSPGKSPAYEELVQYNKGNQHDV
jgi:hypothetical protein